MAVEGLMATGPPAMPKWLLFLRIGIIVLCLGVLIAAGVNIAAFNSWSRYVSTAGPGGFLIFDVIFTWIILGTMIVFELWYHKFYLRLVYVVLLPLAAIFWLSSWAWAASVASAFRGGYNGGFFQDDSLDRYGSSIAACAALGAFTWVAIIVLIIFYVLACMRDSNDTVHQTEMGMHSKSEPTTAAPTTTGAPGGFAEQTQNYYAGQPQAHQNVQQVPQQQQQTPYPVQEIPSPDQPQPGYPAQNTTPYPDQNRIP